MKHFLIALITLALTGQAAFADKFMKFPEVEECVRLDNEIITADKELSKIKAGLDEKREALLSQKEKTSELKAKASQEKAAGNIRTYNTLVGEYNELVAEYAKKLAMYEKLSAEYISTKGMLDKKKNRFTSSCNSRRVFKPDLRKACRESEHSDTPFCKKNLE